MNGSGYSKIDARATGERIGFLLMTKGYSIKDVQGYFGFSAPQAVYKWLWGKSLPSIDSLFALSRLLETPIDDILVGEDSGTQPYYQMIAAAPSSMSGIAHYWFNCLSDDLNYEFNDKDCQHR